MLCFLFDPDNPQHKHPTIDCEDALTHGIEFGCGLGQWEDEFKHGEYITEIGVGGAKSYAYRTSKNAIVILNKGIKINKANDDFVDFDKFIQMVKGEVKTLTTASRFTFKWDTVSKDVHTKYIARTIQSTVHEKRPNKEGDSYNTVPFWLLLNCNYSIYTYILV